MTDEVAKAEAPALKRKISWQEWTEQWNRATDIPARMGLLHTGFDVEVSFDRQDSHRSLSCKERESADYAHRICFYLEVAETPVSLRDDDMHKLARKALTMLAERFFKTDGVTEVLYQPARVLHALLRYFRVAEGITDDIRDSGKFWVLENRFVIFRLSEPVRDIVYQFANSLAHKLWRGEWRVAENVDTTRRFSKVTLHLLAEERLVGLEILAALGREYLLQIVPHLPKYDADGRARRWKQFDDPTLAKLEQLSHILAPTVEEAYLYGSCAAEILVLARIAKAEIKRQEEIEEARKRAEQAQRELESLNAR